MRSRSRFSPTAFRDADPDRAREALRRGKVIARQSGNRANESHLAVTLSRLEALTRRPAGRVGLLHSDDPQLSRLTRHHQRPQPPGCAGPPFSTGSDATNRRPSSGGFAINPLVTAAGSPSFGTAIAHLRDVLREATYESLARKGETMTTAEIVTYAYDQIDQARTELNAVSK